MSRNIKPFKVNPRSIKSRDYLIVALIAGATKAGIHVDSRKQNNKTACRRKNKMPAAVLAHAPKTNTVVDWERDTDLFRVFANVKDIDGVPTDVQIVEIHLLDDALQTAAVINTSMFTRDEWVSIEDAAAEEWRRMRD